MIDVFIKLLNKHLIKKVVFQSISQILQEFCFSYFARNGYYNDFPGGDSVGGLLCSWTTCGRIAECRWNVCRRVAGCRLPLKSRAGCFLNAISRPTGKGVRQGRYTIDD
jgi:hypothetical protein